MKPILKSLKKPQTNSILVTPLFVGLNPFYSCVSLKLAIFAEMTYKVNTMNAFFLDVSCGGHRAATCGDCGDGASYCNGDCDWEYGQCQSEGS